MSPLTALCVTSLLWLQPVLAVSHAAPPSSATPAACTSPARKVHDHGFVPIGGVEQWVTVTGESCANPLVLFLHGGPGNPLTPHSDAMYGAWTKDFTLVQWDQRGSGMTYARSPPEPDARLTIQQMVDDGLQLSTYLTQRYGKRKIILWGSSWGSILGIHMARARPDLFHAYLGTSQVVSYRENQAVSYAMLLALARAAGDAASVAVLEAAGAPPWTNPRNFGRVRRVIRNYEAKVTTPSPQHWRKRASDYATPKAEADSIAGEDFSFLSFVGLNGDGMFSKVDLPGLGIEFAIPMFFVQGRQDLLTAPEVTQRYFESLEAPQKDLVLLDRAGHDPNQDVVDAQFRVLKERILPLTK